MADATFYYAGIYPDPPKLVYRTDKTPWVKPTGPEAYRELKKLRRVFGHKINDVCAILLYSVQLGGQRSPLSTTLYRECWVF